MSELAQPPPQPPPPPVVQTTPVQPPADTHGLLNMGEGDSPAAQAAMEAAVVEQALEDEYQAPAPPPGMEPPHEQAFVQAPQPQYVHEPQMQHHLDQMQQQQQQQQQHPHEPQQPPPQAMPELVGAVPVETTNEHSTTNKEAGEDGDIAVEGEDDTGDPAQKKLKAVDGTPVPVAPGQPPQPPPKRKGRKPGSLNKKRNAYLMDHRGGPTPTWNDMFFALMAFKAKLGTFNVPAQTKLGKWVTKNRQEYSKLQRKKIGYNQCAELSEERIQVLDSLGFIWDTMLHENGRRWNHRFEELKQWKEEHGHCNVPQSTSLGQWVKIQRENKREADLKAAGKLPQRTKPKPCLAPDRIEKLNAIGFQWRVAAPVTGWDNRYNQLLEYAKTHNGDVNVPQYYPADKAFGRWVMKQRSEYSLRLRGLKSQLTDERVDKLNAIGFSWVAPNFKRKVGVGIAPGSPAANVAGGLTATGAAPMAKLPPLETKNQFEPEGVLPAAVGVPQPVPAAAAAAPTTHDPTQGVPHPGVAVPPPQMAPPPLPQPQMIHHQHAPPPVPLEAPGDFQPMHHDPHQVPPQQPPPQPPQQQQYQQPDHLAPPPPPAHHAPPPPPPPDPQQTHNPVMEHHHHPQQPHGQLPQHPQPPQHPPPPPPQHEGMEETINMDFL